MPFGESSIAPAVPFGAVASSSTRPEHGGDAAASCLRSAPLCSSCQGSGAAATSSSVSIDSAAMMLLIRE